MVQIVVRCFSLQTFITLTKPQCQETNVHYMSKYYKRKVIETLTIFNDEWHMREQ